MRLEILFESGRRAEALLLAASRREMRVILEGAGNTDQWEKLDGVWRDASGARIEIEALIVLDGTDWLAFCAEIGTAAIAMGSSPS